jgi:raffinose/stachyose/melibiose transport system substrate-binding protein
VLVVVGSLALAACSAGDQGQGGGEGGGEVAISFLVDISPQTLGAAEQLVKDFNAANSDITVTVTKRPVGADGDNQVKTRLSTGEMSDVFVYNSGSLFQALRPEKNLVPLSGESWVGRTPEAFRKAVTIGDQIYGVPWSTAMGGGVLYNRKVYARLGLHVPKTWADFMANNAKIKAAGVTPVVQTYGDPWTSQLFVLADYHNVAAAEPGFADMFTRNHVKYATDPAAIKGFEHLQQVHEAGYLNKDYASAKLEKGLSMVAAGTGAHYPALTALVGPMVQATPAAATDVGFFAQPGDDAATNGLTAWIGFAAFIPNTLEGAKLAAAKRFVAYIASVPGCESQTKGSTPGGPYLVQGCTLPSDVPQAVKDLLPYFGPDGVVTAALEFTSPLKGPALEHITVEVGSGVRSAADGAVLYDKDLAHQARALGLAGW